jgi:hypothetical protein
LERRGAETLAVTMGVASIEGTVVVEHSGSINASHIQLVNDIQLIPRLPRRAGFAIFVACLALASAPFTPSPLVFVI